MSSVNAKRPSRSNSLHDQRLQTSWSTFEPNGVVEFEEFDEINLSMPRAASATAARALRQAIFGSAVSQAFAACSEEASMVLPPDPAPGIRTGYRNGAEHTDRCSTRCMRTARSSGDRPDFGPPVTTGSHTDSNRSTGTIPIDPAPGIHSNDRCCTGSID